MLSAARKRFATGAAGDSQGAFVAEAGGPVRLLRAQAETLAFEDGSFDGVTFTYLLRYVDDPPAVMRELARVLRPGGRIASLEFGVPPAPAARVAWRSYTGVALPLCGR